MDENFGCFDIVFLILEILIAIMAFINIFRGNASRLDYGAAIGIVMHLVFKVLDAIIKKHKKP